MACRLAAFPAILAALLAFAYTLPAFAIVGNSGKLTEPQRIGMIRGIVAVVGFSRHALPRGKHVVHLASSGKITNLHKLRQNVRNDGIAIPRGGRVEITAVRFHSHSIVFDLNGGPQVTHWYDHLQFGMGGMMQPVHQEPLRIGGGRVELRFPGTVPALSRTQLRKALSPLIEWNLRAGPAITEYHLPPAVKSAIHRHHVLVGMNRTMVVAALGRTQRKYHEQNTQTGEIYTEWVYGKPPAKTIFVRLEGNRVVRIATYYPDGRHLVRDHPEVVIARAPSSASSSAVADDSGPAPTLHRHPRPSLGQQPVAAPMPQHPVVQAPSITPGAPGGIAPVTPGGSVSGSDSPNGSGGSAIPNGPGGASMPRL